MNADEFLALVEMHPLLTGVIVRSLEFDGDSIGYSDGMAFIPPDSADAICDAAPALAAAAIRLLRHPHGGRDQSGICAFCERDDDTGERHTADCPWPALRAALPEALRP